MESPTSHLPTRCIYEGGDGLNDVFERRTRLVMATPCRLLRVTGPMKPAGLKGDEAAGQLATVGGW